MTELTRSQAFPSVPGNGREHPVPGVPKRSPLKGGGNVGNGPGSGTRGRGGQGRGNASTGTVAASRRIVGAWKAKQKTAGLIDTDDEGADR